MDLKSPAGITICKQGTMAERWAKISRVTLGVSLGLASLAVCVVVSCSSDSLPAAGAGGTGQTPAYCSTPQTGCSCTPGSVAACGQKVSGDLSFVYCYEGKRTCGANGAYGECGEGSIVPKALTTIHTSALGTSSACTGSDPGALLVCVTGKKQGEFCKTALDCTGGVKKCLGGPNDGASCKKEKDCADPGDCVQFNGTCNGGTRNGFGCDSLADCPGGALACTPAGGGGLCGSYTGVCDKGSEDGEACNADADCPGGECHLGHGHCQGGEENDKKCRHNKHCKGNVSCSAEDAGSPTALDPCDPYCNVFSDNPKSIDAGAGFIHLPDGGLTTSTAVCGDSVLAPAEACDDGNTTNGDGCTSTCTLEPGFQCPVPGTPCIPVVCGNGIQEGTEACDDGNFRPYDGCAPDCTREVSCPSPLGATAQACAAVCGDGIKFPTEACDDGNLKNGDGCSSICTIEPGASCVAVVSPLPPTLDVPVIYRDFKNKAAVGGHPDFQGPPVVSSKLIPTVTLGADKEPVFLSTGGGVVTSAASFFQWYHDDPTVNKVILGKSIRLAKTGPTTYVFDSNADTAYNDPNINCGNITATTKCNNLSASGAIDGFYPINNLGWGNYVSNTNYHFTSEVRFPFTYAGGETLAFTGDDDVFVYIGGKKVVDLGGIHPAQSASVTLGAGTNTVPASALINLVPGSTYEIAVFQAERQTTGSNYKLTLQGFNRTVSVCTVPAVPLTYVREGDFVATCPAGNAPVWQLFRWKAIAPPGTSIDFRAATAATQAALPATPAAAPTTVPIGSATPTNSPAAANPVVWTYDTLPGPVPVPVSQHLQVEGLGTKSQSWLRVFMTFNGNPTIFEWQQLYDCVPSE